MLSQNPTSIRLRYGWCNTSRTIFLEHSLGLYAVGFTFESWVWPFHNTSIVEGSLDIAHAYLAERENWLTLHNIGLEYY